MYLLSAFFTYLGSTNHFKVDCNSPWLYRLVSKMEKKGLCPTFKLLTSCTGKEKGSERRPKIKLRLGGRGKARKYAAVKRGGRLKACVRLGKVEIKEFGRPKGHWSSRIKLRLNRGGGQ